MPIYDMRSLNDGVTKVIELRTSLQDYVTWLRHYCCSLDDGLREVVVSEIQYSVDWERWAGQTRSLEPDLALSLAHKEGDSEQNRPADGSESLIVLRLFESQEEALLRILATILVGEWYGQYREILSASTRHFGGRSHYELETGQLSTETQGLAERGLCLKTDSETYSKWLASVIRLEYDALEVGEIGFYNVRLEDTGYGEHAVTCRSVSLRILGPLLREDLRYDSHLPLIRVSYDQSEGSHVSAGDLNVRMTCLEQELLPVFLRLVALSILEFGEVASERVALRVEDLAATLAHEVNVRAPTNHRGRPGAVLPEDPFGLRDECFALELSPASLLHWIESHCQGREPFALGKRMLLRRPARRQHGPQNLIETRIKVIAGFTIVKLRALEGDGETRQLFLDLIAAMRAELGSTDPWEALPDPRDREMVRLATQKHSYDEVARALAEDPRFQEKPITAKTVNNRMSSLRQEYGPDMVPEIRASKG